MCLAYYWISLRAYGAWPCIEDLLCPILVSFSDPASASWFSLLENQQVVDWWDFGGFAYCCDLVSASSHVLYQLCLYLQSSDRGHVHIDHRWLPGITFGCIL